jgi:hypothetical protein
VRSGAVVGRWNHLEYRIAIAMGNRYHAWRHTEPGAGLVSAREIVTNPAPDGDEWLSAAVFVDLAWCSILMLLFVLVLGYGALFDGLFYTRSNVWPFVPPVVIISLFIGSIVQALVVRLRRRLLVWSDRRHDQPVHWVLPTRYDCWPGLITAIVLIPVWLVDEVLPILHTA